MIPNAPALAVQTLYLGLLHRHADPAGLAFWTQRVDAGTFTIDQVARIFLNAPEFQNSYAAEGDEELVRSVVFNLFDRNIPQPDVDALIAEAEGLTEVETFRLILDTAREADREAFDAKLAIADYYTKQAAQGEFVPDELTRPDFRSNPELYADLRSLDARFATLELEIAGRSLLGNPLYTATLGEGDTDLLIVTQQHGDEPTGTAGAMLFLEWLAGDTAEAVEVREALTVTVLPRVNPDGWARNILERGGERGLVDPRRNEEAIDLNRAYDPEDPFDPAEAPESQTVIDLVDALDPALVLDYHNQNIYRDPEDGTLDTMSVLWATNEAVPQPIMNAGKRAAVAIEDGNDAFIFSDLTLFPGSENPALARNGLALEGTPTLLIEQRYLEELFELTIGLEQDFSALRSALALEAYISMRSVAEALADADEFAAIDPARADEIPPRTEAIDFTELYSDDDYLTAEEIEAMRMSEIA